MRDCWCQWEQSKIQKYWKLLGRAQPWSIQPTKLIDYIWFIWKQNKLWRIFYFEKKRWLYNFSGCLNGLRADYWSWDSHTDWFMSCSFYSSIVLKKTGCREQIIKQCGQSELQCSSILPGFLLLSTEDISSKVHCRPLFCDFMKVVICYKELLKEMDWLIRVNLFQ